MAPRRFPEVRWNVSVSIKKGMVPFSPAVVILPPTKAARAHGVILEKENSEPLFRRSYADPGFR
jgi:hypothetical protein